MNAETRDVSTNGVYLYTKSRMTEGSNVELILILPPELTSGEKVLGVLSCAYRARGTRARQGVWGCGRNSAHGHTARDSRIAQLHQNRRNDQLSERYQRGRIQTSNRKKSSRG